MRKRRYSFPSSESSLLSTYCSCQADVLREKLEKERQSLRELEERAKKHGQMEVMRIREEEEKLRKVCDRRSKAIYLIVIHLAPLFIRRG